MEQANCLPVGGEIRYQGSACTEAFLLRGRGTLQGCQIGATAGLGSPLKIKLEQVTPASAFCNSDRSIVCTRNPRFSSSARVLGKEAGMITTSSTSSAFAAVGSSSGTSINSNPRSRSISIQDRLTSMVSLPMYE